MSSTDEQTLSKFDALKRAHVSLLSEVNMADLTREVGDVATRVASLPAEIAQIRTRGYAFASYLEHKAEVLANHWNTIQQNVRQTVELEANHLRRELDPLEDLIKRAELMASKPAALAGQLAPIERTMADVKNKANAAEQRIRGMYSTLRNDLDATYAQLQDIGWYLDQKDEASFPFLAGESVFLAAKAEWVATGRGKQDPDGVVFLTDQRMIFEQKETTGKTLGLFGGKKTQEVEWEIPLNQVESVTAENKGLFGGKDMLNFTLKAGAPYATLTVEVKGGVQSKFWAAQVQRMISGNTSDERAIEPDPEMIEALRSAPTACHVCGATLPQLVAGQNSLTCEYCGSVIRV